MKCKCRNYVKLTEACYAETTIRERRVSGLIEEFNVFATDDNEGNNCVYYEFMIRVYSLSKGSAVRVEVFDDAFEAFRDFSDLFEALTKLGKRASIANVEATLNNLGINNVTPKVPA